MAAKTTRLEIHEYIQANDHPVDLAMVIHVFSDLTPHEIAAHINSLIAEDAIRVHLNSKGESMVFAIYTPESN